MNHRLSCPRPHRGGRAFYRFLKFSLSFKRFHDPHHRSSRGRKVPAKEVFELRG
jgi:hypothetical protein